MVLPSAVFARGSVDELKGVIADVRRNCGAEYCRNGLEYRLVHEGSRSSLPDPVVRALFGAAKTQAQIWGDTILEGDYLAKGDTRLDQVFAIRRNGRLVGYRIVFSETARSPYGPGRIVEAAWIHADLRTALTDDKQYAAFIETP